MLAPGIDLYVSEVLGPSSVASTTRKTGHLVEGPTGTAAARMSQRRLTANGYRNGSQSVRTRRGYRLIAEIEGFEQESRRTGGSFMHLRPVPSDLGRLHDGESAADGTA